MKLLNFRQFIKTFMQQSEPEQTADCRITIVNSQKKTTQTQVNEMHIRAHKNTQNF